MVDRAVAFTPEPIDQELWSRIAATTFIAR